MAIEIEPPEPDLSNIRKHLRPTPSLRRLFGWGGLATLALGALAIISQTKGGSERLQQAIATVAIEPVRVVEKDAETRRLEAKLRVLEADRDRLTNRIASLERNLDDMTGSIKKQAEQTAAAPTPASPAPAIAAPATVAPVIASPATVAPVAAPSIVAMNTPPATTPPADAPPALAPLAMPPTAAPQSKISQPSAPQPSAPPVQNAAPAATPITEPVPLPPIRVASAPAVEPAAAPARFQFGIDLGGAANVDALRARWAAVKANFGPLLGGLHPVVARDRRIGSTDYRLVVGPLPNVNAARQLCERFAGQAACRPAKYDGEALVQR